MENYHLQPKYSRLENTENGNGGWMASIDSQLTPWIQVDLQAVKVILKIATQGRHGFDPHQFVMSYTLGTTYQHDIANLEYLRDDRGNIQAFSGNFDADSIVEHDLDLVAARFVRLHVENFTIRATLRWDLWTQTNEGKYLHV